MDTEIKLTDNPEKGPKKRVLFIITQSEMGGAQRFLHTLVNRLNKDRHEIIVAAGPNFSENYKVSSVKYDLLDTLEKEKIKTIRLKYLFRDIGLLNDWRALWELRRVIRGWQPDTIFLNSSKIGFLGSLVAKFLIPNSLRPKIIYRIGGWSFNDPWPNWKKRGWIILEKISAKWKDVIIVNNEHDLEQAKKLKIRPKEKIALIHNGIDVYKTEFLPKEEARLKLRDMAYPMDTPCPYVANGFVVGTIANFYPPKGLKYLIETAEHFKNKDDVIFVIIGDGQERKELELLITNHQLQHKVLLLGQIQDAYKLLSAFDIFVLPSTKEGFPWVVIEAMTAKLSVIATRVGAIPEIIEDGKNGFIVEPARPEQIASRIQELLNNERLRQELGIQAHQTVLFKFSLDKMVGEIENLL